LSKRSSLGGRKKWKKSLRKSRRGRERYKKGRSFENVVAKFFEYKGYQVSRNVRIRGLSGALHEIDVALKKSGKLIGVVEAKNYDKLIPKDWVMKIYEVGKDVGASEIYVVSATGFTEDAEKVAKVLGVQLLNLDDMIHEVERIKEVSRMLTLYVKPVYGKDTAREYALPYVRRRFFFEPMEEVTHVSLVYAPFYLVEGERTEDVVEGSSLLGLTPTKHYKVKWRVQLLVLANGSSLLYCKEEDLCELVEIPQLSDDEVKLLLIMLKLERDIPTTAIFPIIGGFRGLYYDDLEKETGWSRSKLSRIVNSLVDKRFVKVEKDIYEKKILRVEFPTLKKFVKSTKTILEKSELVEGAPSGGEVYKATIPPNNIKALIERLFEVEVKDTKILYLPVYRVKLESLDDETYRYLCFFAARERALLKPCID